MRKSIAAAVIAASAATAACSHDRGEEGGPTVTRNYQVGNFQQIEVAGAYDVDVRTGANPGVSARGPQKLLENTVVEVKGDKLYIRPQSEKGWFHFGWSHQGKAEFTVTVPQLNEATIAGSGDAKAGTGKAQSAEYEIAGSGDVDGGGVTADQAKVSIAGSGSIKAHATGAANVDIMGSGDVEVTGGAKCNISKAGSGDVRCS